MRGAITFSDRRIWLAAIALVALVALTLLAAPHNPESSGSTFSRAPDGYGAWYAYMQQQGTPIQRWQKSPLDLINSNQIEGTKEPMTLLLVRSELSESFYLHPDEWIKRGNTLVVLGIRTPVTKAAFTTLQDSGVGSVKIDTRRRLDRLETNQKRLLGDNYGAIVWQETLGKGKIIGAATPHLGANAYQDTPGNYKFLAQLVKQDGHPIWVDEYLHGYKDKQIIQQETSHNWAVYLAKTPLLPVLVQVGVLLLVLIWAQNRRFGQPQILTAPTVDNSEAYIQALASVLHKAESSEFILEVVGKEEQLQLQSDLGLGRTPIDHETLIDAWVQQTGHPAAELQAVLRSPDRQRRISEPELLTWLKKVQAVRNALPGRSTRH